MANARYTIDHVQITLPREVEEAAKRFYGEVLGLEEIPKPPELAGRGGAWYRAGSCELHVSVEALAPGTNQASRRHVCFVVGDLDAEEARLRAAGVEVLPDTQPVAGWRRFYVRDPGGNRVEVAMPAP
jgi:catechol 2,3-dioxygenase-like lactoylglutathione lyase family enzyme